MIAQSDAVAPGAAGVDLRFLADVDAALNGVAFVLICAGLVAVKRGNVELHKKLMLIQNLGNGGWAREAARFAKEILDSAR